MIAQSKWFTRRKYTGWGLTPKTWQGFLYIAIIAVVASAFQALPISESIRIVLTGIWVTCVLIDILHVMASMKLDELEQKIEAIAERNASWTIVTATALVIMYVATVGTNLTGTELIPVFVIPIIAGTIVKGVTYYILDKRGI